MTDDNSPSDFNSSNVQVFNINTLKDFNPGKRVRKKLFITEQLWSEIVCYEPGQSTVMHKHPLEEEMCYVIEGTANTNIGGEEGRYSAGELIKLPVNIMHDYAISRINAWLSCSQKARENYSERNLSNTKVPAFRPSN